MPGVLRFAAARAITGMSPATWDRLYRQIEIVLPSSLRQAAFGDKIHKFASIVSTNLPEATYRQLMSHWAEPESVVLEGHEPPTYLSAPAFPIGLGDFTERMMWLDTLTYLPDDILVKVDRAAMSVSLESRMPLLDHRIVEWAWRLPLKMRVRSGKSKWALREVLYKYVPSELIDRPKMGFGVPIDAWLRGPLREWAEALLNENKLKREGFLDPTPIRQKWLEHLSGRRNWQYHLWDVLMFQAWLGFSRA
jgi:asparagine synthase (glutamine-hydrolysing)